MKCLLTEVRTTRRPSLVTLMAVICLASSALTHAAPPNIVLCMADDQQD
ncbi:MAG: hypothetical protein GY903_00325 [Fuerstiella sp.]|nr:hypothetical protein [Fuerstiella sp.]MCP4852924.1 hypothetical protein [Fuerstiella sp.]